MKTAIIYAGKTAIVYAGKYGATQEIANRLAAKIDGAEAFNLKGSTHPNLNDYDCVIIGSAVYAGAVQKEAKAFAVANEAALRRSEWGYFCPAWNRIKKR